MTRPGEDIYDYPKEENLICEALIREIPRLERWSAIVEVWQALIWVRKRGTYLKGEFKRIYPERDDKPNCAE